MDKFRDRREAGRRLAVELKPYADEHPVVLGLPRGGMIPADEVARALDAPLDVLVVRKVGVPWQPELGAGAVAEGGHVHLSEEVLRYTGLSESELHTDIDARMAEVEERVRRFRGDRSRIALCDRTVIVVDDGIATGGTVRAAVGALRAEGAKKVVVATPVGAFDTIAALAMVADAVVCLRRPRDFYAVGLWYEDFAEVTDEEVAALLEKDPGCRPRRSGEDHLRAGPREETRA